MSKNMLDPIVRGLVGLPESRLGAVADIVNRLNSERGEEWSDRFKAVLREGLAPSTVFERNEHGHIIIAFTGLNRPGNQEIARLEAAGYRVSDYAKSCFASTDDDGYDKNHRLVAGQAYKIALVPGKEIKLQSDRTTANLRKLGEKYGYGKPLAGHTPRIRESVSDKQMEEMGIWYVASLHDPIKDSDGGPCVLYASRNDDGQLLGTCWDSPDGQWGDSGAFAFPVLAS